MLKFYEGEEAKKTSKVISRVRVAIEVSFDFKMNKGGLLSGLKRFEQYKSLPASTKASSMLSRPSSDNISSGSFANLKLTAEKLVKEQASVKTDLEIANTKLKKSMEDIRVLQEKLQQAFNDNAKHKVKQKEDEKLWKGLESKFSSTKTLCDQLTETLQYLAGQVQDAEKDKKFFEDKLSASLLATDDLANMMNDLLLKLEEANETIKSGKEEVKDLKLKIEEQEVLYKEEQHRAANLVNEKDFMIKQLEGSVAAGISELEGMNSWLTEVHLVLRTKDDDIKSLKISLENLEKENSDFQSSNEAFSMKLVSSLTEIKYLNDLVQLYAAKLTDIDKQSLTLSEKLTQLNSVYEAYIMLSQEKMELAARSALQQYNNIEGQLLCTTSERDEAQLLNLKFLAKIADQQRVHESFMVQHAEECQFSEDKIRKLESEAEQLALKNTELEVLATELEEKIGSLSKHSSLSEDKMQELVLKLSTLESERKRDTDQFAEEMGKKVHEFDILQKEWENCKQQGDSMEKQFSELQNDLEEKQQLIQQIREKEKQLEDQNTEVLASLAAAESKLSEARKQYDLMLESKQLELSRHLKEISQKNDQAINDIRRKYEIEKQEMINVEKQKADKLVCEIKKDTEEKLAKSKQESTQNAIRLQEEHTSLVDLIEQEHARKETHLKAAHSEELKRIQNQAETELREKVTLLRNEREVQIKALRLQHEDVCRELREELDLQKSKEDRQRALLQMQWRVMSDKPQEEPEVNSKKDNSISAAKMRTSDATRKNQHNARRVDYEEEDLPMIIESQTPIANVMKKVELVNAGSLMNNVPKHSKKVPHYDDKRRKTKRTATFEDPEKRKRITTPRSRTPRAVKVTKEIYHHPPLSNNIGDLFSEGSLNPYADDPYAFD